MENKIKFKIYLAGYSKDLEYRKIVKEKYDDKFIINDPMNYTFDEIYKSIGKTLSDIFIIRKDKKLIEDSDLLIAKIEYLPTGQMMIGTLMEIMYAYEKGVPVFVISSNESILENPWIKFHCLGRFYNIDECFEFILNKDKE